MYTILLTNCQLHSSVAYKNKLLDDLFNACQSNFFFYLYVKNIFYFKLTNK